MARADKPDDRVVWIDRGWQPVFIGFCPTRSAWKREMRKMGVRGVSYPDTAGSATTFTKDDKTSVIITLRDGVEATHSEEVVLGLLVHECTHDPKARTSARIWRKARFD